jgi:tripartite-type tricarboxylate transporter receptor subunit TctC
VAPPGVPAARLAILRDAFAATMKDPAFLADTAKIRFTIEPMSADEVTQIVHGTVATPPGIITKAKVAMGLADR